MDREKTTKQIGIRVTDSFYERVNERSAEEGRTISNLIIKVVSDYLDNVDEAKKILKK